MAWQEAKYSLKGSAPMIHHNGALADPLNPIAKVIKQITGKRKKTDADQLEIAHLEFVGGLYLNGNGPMCPAVGIEATIINAAKKTKEGTLAKAGMYVPESADVEYDGPRDPEKMWLFEQDGDFPFRYRCPVRVGMAKVMRMRPIFKEWALHIKVMFEDTIVNKSRVDEWIETAGTQVGMFEWRPRHGRFSVEK